MGTGRLDGQTALVTGASASIGLASALELARDGARVVIMGRSPEGLARACAEIRAEISGGVVETFAGDGCDEAQIKSALEHAHSLAGRLDIVVSTVGGAIMQPLLMRSVDSVRRELEVNIISTFLAIRHGAPMLKRGGAIVCISSVAVTQTLWGLGLYGAAKAAVERLVKSAAFELGGAGIRVNAVRPGMTIQHPGEHTDPTSGAYADYAAATPLGRVGLPDDIARVVRFLAGPESAWVTGQTFSADGGQEQGRAPDHMDMIFGKEAMEHIRAGQPMAEGSMAPVLASTSLA